MSLDKKYQRNNDYTTGNGSHYLYHQNYYKRIGINLLRQGNSTILQKLNFSGKPEKDNKNSVLHRWKSAKN